MGNVCKGEEIDFKDLRTEEQKQMMQLLGGIIAGNIKKGATPFPGPRNAPPDMGQMAAMNTMMGIGGYGPYSYNPIPMGSQPPIGMGAPFPLPGPNGPVPPPDDGGGGGQMPPGWDWKYPDPNKGPDGSGGHGPFWPV